MKIGTRKTSIHQLMVSKVAIEKGCQALDAPRNKLFRDNTTYLIGNDIDF